MTRDELVEMLRAHKVTRARRANLAIEAEEMLIRINRAAANDAVVMANRAPGGDGTPRGNRISKPVEAAGIRSMDGDVSEQMAMWLEESKQMQEELLRLGRMNDRVENAMRALSERERVVVERHIMDGVSWAELVAMSPRIFGVTLSRGTLRRIKDGALDKMLSTM